MLYKLMLTLQLLGRFWIRLWDHEEIVKHHDAHGQSQEQETVNMIL